MKVIDEKFGRTKPHFVWLTDRWCCICNLRDTFAYGCGATLFDAHLAYQIHRCEINLAYARIWQITPKRKWWEFWK